MLLLYLLDFLAYVAIINAGLAVFNLFPIPPLDGSKVLFSILPDRIYEKLMRYEKYGMLLLVLILVLGVLDVPLSYLRNGLLDAAYALASPMFERLAMCFL